MKAQCCGRLIGLGLLAGLLAGASDAQAITTQIIGNIDFISGPPNQTYNYESFNTSASTSQSNGINKFLTAPGENPLHFSGNVYTAADGSGAHVNSNMQMNRSGPISSSPNGFISLSASGQATVTFSDVVINGTGTTPFMTRFAVHVDGSTQASATQYTNSPIGAADAASAVSVTVGANGQSLIIDAYHQMQAQGGADTYSIGYGGLETFDGSEELLTDYFEVTPNKPFSVTLSLGVRSQVAINDNGSGSALSITDFSNTLSFATGRPVFELPAGYTVNSESAGIVNNRFVGAGEPPVIPEPTSLVLLGLVAPLAMRRVRQAL